MRAAVLVGVWVLVSGAALGQPGSQPVSVQQVALAWVDAVAAGDLKVADAGCVSFEAWKAISKRALDPKAHRARHGSFVRGLHRELSGGTRVTGVELKDVLVLPAGVKRHRAVTMAVFHMGLAFPDGKADKPLQVPLLFLQIDDGWYLMVRD